MGVGNIVPTCAQCRGNEQRPVSQREQQLNRGNEICCVQIIPPTKVVFSRIFKRKIWWILLFLNCLVSEPSTTVMPPHLHPTPKNWSEGEAQTCGIPRVDDTQHLGVTVVFSLPDSTSELIHIQGPAILFIQIIVHLDGTKLRDDCWVEGVLRDRDHHTRPWLASSGHQDLQDGLQWEDTSSGPSLLPPPKGW